MTRDEDGASRGGRAVQLAGLAAVGRGRGLVGLARLAGPGRRDRLGRRAGARASRGRRPPATGEISLALGAFAEDEPGDRIRDHLATTWPAFPRWWREGANARPTAAQARARLEEHMPELVPAWQRLTAMVEGPGAADAGPALALWNPPPFLTGCSQAAILDGGPALIRNYDWDYRLFDAAVASTAYACRRVLGMLDCLWGLLDGVNDAGLAVSLTFGGRPQVGEGFGIPLVIRYVLEICATAQQAVAALRRIPVHMSYNVTVLDAAGQRATVYLAPDRPARVTDLPVATNHQGRVEWEPYAAAIRSVERQEHLEHLLADACGRGRRSGRLPAVRRCTPPASTRASGPCTPPSTGPPTAWRAITGRAGPGTSRWTRSTQAASRSPWARPERGRAGSGSAIRSRRGRWTRRSCLRGTACPLRRSSRRSGLRLAILARRPWCR